jgi:predicted O-linked N-acetylglucosamine transferase (SPINDLY family)
MTTDELLATATTHHRAGDLAAARLLYEQILQGVPAMTPAHTRALFRRGLLELQDSHPLLALTYLEQAVAAAPGESQHHTGLGSALQALGRWEDAVGAYRRVLELVPGCADAQFSLGLALQALERFEEAVGAYAQAALWQPDYFAALNNLGMCQQRCGRFTEAATAYGAALALRPDAVGTTANLGTVLQALGRLDEAVRLLRSAVAREPQVDAHAVNLGIALCRQRDFSGAEAVLRVVWNRNPSAADAAFNLGNALYGLGNVAGAAELYGAAVAVRPDFADALINLGNTRKELGDFTAAAAAYEAAIRAQPESIVALNNAGCLLRTLGRFDEAEALFRRGLQLNAGHAALYDNLGSVLKDVGDIDGAIDCFRTSLTLNPDNAATHSNLVYSLSFQSMRAEPLLAECRRWNERFAASLPLSAPPALPSMAHANVRAPERRLRIGYVSPDFRDHCQSLFTLPLLSRHDHRSFEIVCYSSVARPDDTTRRIAALADEWREVRPLNDEQLAEVIRDDRIDILVDLTMHMAHGRPLVFARKPAPLQVAWLAYPGTTGLAAMDYRLSDARLDPDGHDAHYSEATLRLPDAFWCYDPLTTDPPVNELPALARGHVTFGCLNNPCKLTDATLNLWSGVLEALPAARLRLMAPPGRARRRLVERLAAHAVEADRVHFVPHRPRAEYLLAYHDIDIALDTFPYNGHTTSLDAYWMGVPTVSRVGGTCVGRGGLSQAFQLGLPQLAATTDQGFLDAARELAGNLAVLAALRRELRGRLECSPLMDAARFAGNVEAAYRAIWRVYCARHASADRHCRPPAHELVV